MTAQPPLTPVESDLRDFPFMPLDVVRLAQSDLVAFEDPSAVLAAILLWGASWHGKPAGSLTNDDRALAKAAGYGRGVTEWLAVKDGALRGFVECSDGRLYHPVVAEKVRDAWAGKLRQRHRTYCAAVRKHNERNDVKLDAPSYERWEALGRPKEVAALLAQDRPAQSDLPLPAPDQGGEEDVSHATRGNVTRDKGGMSRDPDSRVTRFEGSKGEGEREREGQGEGDSYNNNNRGSRAVDDDAVFDLIRSTDDLARRAGVPHTQPTSINRNLEVVREWYRDGISLADVVTPIVDEFRLDKPNERVASLRFFDASVRARVAAQAAKDRGKGKPHRITTDAPAVAQLATRDADDTRIATIRARLNGKPEHAPDVIALAVDDDGPTLIVTARSRFAATRIDRHLFESLWNDATGSHEVEVRVQ